MAAERGILSAFENATGIDVPDSIAGISIPDPDIGDVCEAASSFLDGVGDMQDLVEKAVGMRDVVAKGRRAAGNCWGVIDQAAEVYSNISRDIEPLSPLLRLGQDLSQVPQAMAIFSKDSLDACVRLIGDAFGLGKLLQKISSILEGVKKIFEAIMETCGDVIEKVMDFVADLAQAFTEALHLDTALEGIMDLFSGIASIVGELADISNILKPVVEAWESANFFEAGAFAFQHFGDVKDAFCRFWPAWEESQRQYESARGFGESAANSADKAWATVRPLVQGLCNFLHVDLPGGLDGADREAEISVAPRSGFELQQFEPVEAPPPPRAAHLQLFDQARDGGDGLPHEAMAALIGRLEGLSEDEINDMVVTADTNGDGMIDEGEFDSWFNGDAICDEDRAKLLEG
mmetsp:Transcript_88306/g.263355  ORF Transcript_88306/g.263355 Transcript_88306/m.263355 type:complete len:404 (+) Transcript_88306:69-1280(+)